MLKIIPAPTSAGSFNQGSELAPQALLDHGLLKVLKANGLDVQLLEPITEKKTNQSTSKIRNHGLLTNFNKDLYKLATENIMPTDQLLTLGGDHAISVGSMFATKTIWPEAKIIYIDAHPDCNQPKDSPTGNMHGVPVSTVLGDALYSDYLYPKYDYSEILLIAIKDIDQAEADYLKKHNITAYTISDIVEHGIGWIVSEAMTWANDKLLHISLDIDSIDGSYAPGTGIVNKGGLTYREVKYLTHRLADLHICSVDLVEVNPKSDIDGKTVELAIELIAELLHGDWSPYKRYLMKH